jgi:hypothetical protein
MQCNSITYIHATLLEKEMEEKEGGRRERNEPYILLEKVVKGR